MPVLRPYTRAGDPTVVGYVFWCPGCKQVHQFTVTGPRVWTFDGNLERPTFSPSLLVYRSGKERQTLCHLKITDGQIQYLNDSPHELAGRTVPMEEFRWE